MNYHQRSSDITGKERYSQKLPYKVNFGINQLFLNYELL